MRLRVRKFQRACGKFIKYGYQSSWLGLLLFSPLFLSFVLKIPDADGDAKDCEKQLAQRLDAVLIVSLPNRIAPITNPKQDEIPPLPFFAFWAAAGGWFKQGNRCRG